MRKITTNPLLQKLKKLNGYITKPGEVRLIASLQQCIIVAFICILYQVAYGQANLIPWNEKDRLEWYDFCGKVNDSSRFHAQCFAEVSYVYKFNKPKDFEFAVFASFNKETSWIKKEYQSEVLLEHEQVHFDIAQLLALRMKEVFENYNYTEDFRTETQLLFNKTKREYDLMQHQYDLETDHSLNKQKQKEWEAFVSDQLTAIKLKQEMERSVVTGTRKTR